jgi:hypothetical protein
LNYRPTHSNIQNNSFHSHDNLKFSLGFLELKAALDSHYGLLNFYYFFRNVGELGVRDDRLKEIIVFTGTSMRNPNGNAKGNGLRVDEVFACVESQRTRRFVLGVRTAVVPQSQLYFPAVTTVGQPN